MAETDPASGDGAHPLVGTRVGSYRISREIARGGMGVVFEAVHDGIGHRVAVKVLMDGLTDDPRHADYVARFFDEARAVNLIRHPGILKVTDFGELPAGGVFIMMELLEGESLWDRIWARRQSGAGIAPADAMRTVRQIASAMAAAHRERILHRDLKPENVFLVEDPDIGGGERVKVLDFGIARFLDSPYRRTTLGIVLGTPIYMSPEQCEGGEVLSDKVDVYALGVMAYELLAGHPPFEGETGHLLRMHAGEAPRPLAGLAPGLPEAVYRLVHDMLQKAPAARPTMAEVARRIAALEGQLTLEAPRVAPGGMVERQAGTMLVTGRRDPALRPQRLLLGGAAGAVLVLLIGLLLWLLR